LALNSKAWSDTATRLPLNPTWLRTDTNTTRYIVIRWEQAMDVEDSRRY